PASERPIERRRLTREEAFFQLVNSVSLVVSAGPVGDAIDSAPARQTGLSGSLSESDERALLSALDAIQEQLDADRREQTTYLQQMRVSGAQPDLNVMKRFQQDLDARLREGLESTQAALSAEGQASLEQYLERVIAHTSVTRAVMASPE
ncbi:MAG: hypothetical protein MI861_11290, partial [Pirellulales bacterium]|nr:hypothetical protein [Pirellulales bacterium]